MAKTSTTRAKGSGSLREREPGVWELRVNLDPDPLTGARRQRSKTFRGTARAAQRALAALVAEAEGDRAGSGITVEKLLRDWMTRVEKDRSPTTVDMYWWIIDTLWIPRLGHVLLDDLKPRHIQAVLDAEHGRPNRRTSEARARWEGREQELVAELADARRALPPAGRRPNQKQAARRAAAERRVARLERDLAHARERLAASRAKGDKPVSAATVLRLLAPLRRALAEAVQLELIERSPADSRLVKPRDPSRQRDDPTTEEILAVLRHAGGQDPALGMMLLVDAATGVRRGELCGMRWRGVDLEAGTVKVSKNVVVRRNRASTRPAGVKRQARQVVVKDTKTHADRTVPIDAATVEMLRRWRAFVEAVARREGVRLHRDAFVFSLEPNGSRPLMPEGVSRGFKRAADAVGVPAHLHHLRHFSATTLLAKGIPTEIVSRRLGHRDPSITTDIYGRLNTGADAMAAAVLGEALEGAGPAALPEAPRRVTATR